MEKEDGTKETVADHQTWAEDTSLKTADFSPVRAKKVKLLVHRSGGSHATIAELNLYGDTSVNGLKTTLWKVTEITKRLIILNCHGTGLVKLMRWHVSYWK